MTDLEIAEKVAWSYHGDWYKWGGSTPAGFDCSGYVCEILQSAGKIGRKEDFSALGLYQRFSVAKVNKPELGCLVFYGLDETHITHVEFCLDEKHSIGASGGGSHCLTLEDAIMMNAFIKVRPIQSRNDIVGFVNPF